ncbi:helix-turn-helix domain-containing protein [Rhodococcus pyridinivorans]|uniref:helix-turn-helix domain-containing protein n=1 Tax=Rhodococcus pyridinivorans TaxID=103816 RepID=UPI00280A7890|nr:helix-turn-helix domain-containing protein [Rhodococcus pyridinivorans]WMM74273.1 helix-turn-helix domain-containing protein [Rhodococcus pyridinivorans]
MFAEDVIGAREAEQLLGVSQSTLNRWIKTGLINPVRQLPGYRGAYLFDRADVLRFAESRKKVRA